MLLGSNIGQDVKDFDYMRFVNQATLRDEVLDRFLEKSEEMHQAAGIDSVNCKNALK